MADRVCPLRCSIVRRLPTERELSERAGLALTARDVELLIEVHRHGLLTAELVELALFPPVGAARRAPSSVAHERLRRLWLWGYLDRLKLPVGSARGGRRPYLYTLGPRGVGPVAARLGEGTAPVRRRRLDRVDDVFVKHDLMAAAVGAGLTALAPATLVRRLTWVAERELRVRRLAARHSQTGYRLPVLPDGLFELVYANGVAHVGLLEVDMGTLTLARFRRKRAAFELYLLDGQFRRDWGRTTFEGVVVTHSEVRSRHLREAARAIVPDDRWGDYLFGTFDALAPGSFEDAAWLTLDDEEVGLLYKHAYPPDPDGEPATEGAAEAGAVDPLADAGAER